MTLEFQLQIRATTRFFFSFFEVSDETCEVLTVKNLIEPP